MDSAVALVKEHPYVTTHGGSLQVSTAEFPG
jgi:hypothetical protein